MGFLIKIYTNGGRPDVLECLIAPGSVDYVAIDFKAPKEQFRVVSGSDLYDAF